MTKIAIIGAGVSGLSAAYRLSKIGADIQVFEKSKGLSGRAASRSKNGCRYDHGANYFKLENPDVARFLFDELPSDDLCVIPGDIATFDQEGKVSPGDPNQNTEKKWNYGGGINTLGKLIVQSGDLNVARNVQISSVIMEPQNTWTLHDVSGRTHEGFDALLISTPAPQTISLLQSTNLDPYLLGLLTDELAQSHYHTQFTVAQNFRGIYELPGQAYALINTDRNHDIAWLSHENLKSGRIPESETLLIAQMSPAWSQKHYEDDRDDIIKVAYKATNGLLGESLPALNWADTQRWRYAHPHSAARIENLKPGSCSGLFFCGDAFVGKGRIPGAIETGFAAATQIKEHLGLTRSSAD